MKEYRMLTRICFLMVSALLTSCLVEKEQNILHPEISGIKSEYILLEGNEVELTPVITNDNDAIYQWILNGKKVASTPYYLFNMGQPGENTLLFKVETKGGIAQKEIIITVIAKGLPPFISSIEEEYSIEVEEDLTLTPTITSDEEVTYAWFIKKEEVSNSPTYTFSTTQPGRHELVLKVTNQGGTSEKRIIINAVPDITKVQTEAYTILSLTSPWYLSEENEIKWEITTTSSELYRLSYADTTSPLFVAAKEGEYRLQVSGKDIAGTVIITVNKRSNTPSPYIAKVFDYLPAPGQFVNKLPDFQEGDTHEDMVRKAGEWLVGENAWMITLGGWGGYVEFGFDHTIVNVPGKRDFRINGNAFGSALGRPNAPFGGSCEPGIIMVAYDKNKNGKPDEDEWYEINGSANFTANNEPWYQIAVESGNDTRVFRNYEMTYYRPTSEEPEIEVQPDNPNAFASIQNYIRWEDNQNNSGYKVKNVYHTQTYYPAWVTEDKLTYKGIRLPENGVNEGAYAPGINEGNVYFVLYGFRYGYVDNHPNVQDGSAIDIDWAIDKKGNKANLPGIDFVRIYNGVNQENGWIGETSTEVERGTDLHLIGESIDTIIP